MSMKDKEMLKKVKKWREQIAYEYYELSENRPMDNILKKFDEIIDFLSTPR